MSWIVDKNDGLILQGNPHFSVVKVANLVEQLEGTRSNHPEVVCEELRNILRTRRAPKRTIWRLSKWCHWPRKYPASIATEISELLFYGLVCNRLLDKRDQPIPNEREADRIYRDWKNAVVAATISTEQDRYAEELLANIENEIKNRNDLKNMLAQIDEKMKSVLSQGRKAFYKKIERSDGKIVKILKEYHGYRCQFPDCEADIRTRSGGRYVEVAHIDAFGKGGRSILANLLVLCPNHHKEFDLGDLETLSRDETLFRGKLNGRAFKIGLLENGQPNKSLQ